MMLEPILDATVFSVGRPRKIGREVGRQFSWEAIRREVGRQFRNHVNWQASQVVEFRRRFGMQFMRQCASPTGHSPRTLTLDKEGRQCARHIRHSPRFSQHAHAIMSICTCRTQPHVYMDTNCCNANIFSKGTGLLPSRCASEAPRVRYRSHFESEVVLVLSPSETSTVLVAGMRPDEF